MFVIQSDAAESKSCCGITFLVGRASIRRITETINPTVSSPSTVKTKNGIQAMPAGMVKDEAWNRQCQHESEEEPVGTNCERFR